MPKTNYRIGQIVPSSNTTMETEIPAMLTARQLVRPERFTFHSSRMRMKTVKKEELAAMDAESDRCALELSDARPSSASRRAPRTTEGTRPSSPAPAPWSTR
jgi:maleate isomerase